MATIALLTTGVIATSAMPWAEMKQRLDDKFPTEQHISAVGHHATQRRIAESRANEKLLDTLIGYSFSATPVDSAVTPSTLPRPSPDYIRHVLTDADLAPTAGARQKTYHSRDDGYYCYARLPIAWLCDDYERLIDRQLDEARAAHKAARRQYRQNADAALASTSLRQGTEWLRRADVLQRVHRGLGGPQAVQAATSRSIAELQNSADTIRNEIANSPRQADKRAWYLGARLGASVLTGVIGAEFQIGHLAFNLGFIPDWLLGGVKLYQHPFRNGWYAAAGGGMRYETNDKKAADIFGALAGYRWTHPHTSLDIALGLGAGVFKEDKDSQTVMIWDASIGCRF